MKVGAKRCFVGVGWTISIWENYLEVEMKLRYFEN